MKPEPRWELLLGKATLAAAWNVQGPAATAPFVDEVQRSFGLSLPAVPNTRAQGDGLAALWLGPSSWLLVAGGSSSLTDFAAKRDALNAAGGALFDVSASRVAYTIAGPRASDLLAKACPLDFHSRAFPPESVAQSLLWHVNALFIKRADDDYAVLVARSYARDVWRALRESGAQYGHRELQAIPFR